MKRFLAIGNRIRGLRGQKSQQEFAAEIGIPFRTYQRYEAGESAPKREYAEQIALACGKTVDYIMSGGDAPVELDIVSEKILLMLRDMDEGKKRDVLKYAEEKKLLMELQGQRKKHGGGR